MKKLIFLLFFPFVSLAQDIDSLIETANDPMMSNPRKSIRLLENSLEILQNEGNGMKTKAAEIAEKIADNLFVINEFEESIHYYQKASEIYQKNGVNDRRYFCMRKIARANLELQNYDSATEWLGVAKAYFTQIGREALLAGTYILEAEIEAARGNYTKAEDLLGRSVAINNRLENYSNLADNYRLLGKIKLIEKQYPEAENNFITASGFYSKTEDNINFINTNFEIAQIRIEDNQISGAEQLLDSISQNVNSINNPEIFSEYYYLRYLVNFKNDNKALALDYLQKHMEQERIASSTVDIARRSRETIRSLNDQNEFDRLLEQRKTVERQRLLLGGIGLLLVIAIFLFLNISNKRQSNRKLKEINSELEEQKKRIVDSIEYAEKIQKAFLPKRENLKYYFDEFFIIYKPRDIVSGDFYWVNESSGFTFLIAADCTGHGVPGAFMSLIGFSMLNNIIIENKIIQPGVILDKLNSKVIEALGEDNPDGISDGMDLAVIRVDKNNNELIFSGAKRPLWILENCRLKEIKGTRQSIGGSSANKGGNEFEENIIQLSKNSFIYLTSDGFADQNNSAREKIGNKNFKKLIENNSFNPPPKQKEILEKFLESHMGSEPQRDDVTVICVKI